DGQAAGKSLDRARDLVRGQESLAERMRQRRLGEGGDPADTSHANAQGSKGAPGNQQGQGGQQNPQGGRQNGQQSAAGGRQGQNDQQSKGQTDQQSKGQKGQNGQQQGQA